LGPLSGVVCRSKGLNPVVDPMIGKLPSVNGRLREWATRRLPGLTFHAGKFLDTFVEYPPSQPPASFTVDQIEKDVERKIRELAKGAGSRALQ
jgi:arylsulfatase